MSLNSMTQIREIINSLGTAINKSSQILITDEKWNIQYVNDSFSKQSQYKKEELMGKKYSLLNAGLMPESYFKKMMEEIESGKIWIGRTVIRLKNGTQSWFRTTIVPVKNKNTNQYVFFNHDINQELNKEKEIISELEKYRIISENSQDLVVLVDDKGYFRYASPSFQTLLNYNPKSLLAENIFDYLHQEDVQVIRQIFRNFCKGRKDSRQIEIRLLHQDGTPIDFDAHINTIHNHFLANDELILFVMRDIRDRKVYENNIYHLAFHDPLTDLPNRRLFTNKLREELKNAQQFKTNLAVMFIDMDNFKEINDLFGHDIGDLALKEAAKRINDAIHPTDFVGRIGGDEFIVIVQNFQNDEEVINYAKYIADQFQKPIKIPENQNFPLTISIGIATFPSGGETAEELIKNADEAMYSIKRNGKQNIKIFDHQLKEQSLERRLLENALRTGIKEKQFYLEYQPKFNIITNELIGMEALVRWNHPDLGKISPGKFIPLAEETGLIVPLGEWILRESIRQTKEWIDQGYPPLSISINISVRQLEDSNFVKKLRKIINKNKIDPKSIELEVTESIFADVKNVTEVLTEIRDLGVKISVDDFGTGYSSLSYIKNLPIDILKVDQSFIQDIHINEESKAIVRAVLTLAQTIGLKVIAEGVEIEEQVKELSKDGYLYGQGYYFSKPLSSKEFENYLKFHTA